MPYAFFAVVSIAVIGLYIAYVIPIFLRWRMGDDFEPGPWTNGRKYKWMNLFATIWVGIITVIFCLPTTPAGVPWDDAFDWKVVQLRAAHGRASCSWSSGVWWLASAKSYFTGLGPDGRPRRGRAWPRRSVEPSRPSLASGAR